MENKVRPVEKLHEGTSSLEAGAEVCGCDEHVHAAEAEVESPGQSGQPESEQSESSGGSVSPEPKLTERQIRQLRNRFFTVRRDRLTNCGHKFNANAPPKNNCENCWWTYFNTHPELVKLTDEVYREHGKLVLIGMRGKKYTTMFGRFMSTVLRLKQEEEALRQNVTQSNQPGSLDGSVEGLQETGGEIIYTAGTVDEGGETEVSRLGVVVTQ